MKFQKQLKGKTSKKFGAVLWKHRQLTSKQLKNLLLQNKKLKTKKLSNFGTQLMAKQLVASLYGNLKLQQFKNLLKQSEKYKGKITHVFFSLLEKRLDSCLVQAKFVPTFFAAKQLINHHKVFVNGNLVSSPGFALKPGDFVTFEPKAKPLVASNLQKVLESQKTSQTQFYKSLAFEVNYKTLEGIFLFSPQQIHYPTLLEPELVIKALR
jgi:small subunit ribosomal protein S4